VVIFEKGKGPAAKLALSLHMWQWRGGNSHVATAAFGRPSEGEAPRHLHAPTG